MVLFFINKKELSFENVVDDIILGLESWCVAFNDFFLIFVQYIKFIFVFIILAIGILTLLRLRGIYLQPRLKKVEKDEDTLTKSRLILGTLYISFAFGILFNYGTYFIIWILDPLPDRLIFNFIDIVLSLWYLINNNRIINNPRRTVEFLFAGVMGCILFGFTPFLPFFL